MICSGVGRRETNLTHADTGDMVVRCQKGLEFVHAESSL